MKDFLDLFDLFDTDTLSVADFEIKVGGAIVTHLRKNGENVEVWSGDPDDKHSEELIVDEDDRERFFNLVYDLI